MITKELTDEHKNILKIADLLIDEAEKLKIGKPINKDFFEKAVFFIRNYADKFHHAKEEDILFKEICNSADNGEMHCNPVQQMLFEHDEGRKLVKGVEEGTKKSDKNEVIENSEGYANLIREHIFKEDNILYPMAEEAFSEEMKKEMKNKFDSADKKSKKIEAKCLKILKEIEK